MTQELLELIIYKRRETLQSLADMYSKVYFRWSMF
jgi:hypothetical protein